MTTADELVQAVADQFDVSVRQIMSERQDEEIVLARHAAMFAVRERLGWSQPRIGRFFGRDHSTVHYALRRVEVDMPGFAASERQRVQAA